MENSRMENIVDPDVMQEFVNTVSTPPDSFSQYMIPQVQELPKPYVAPIQKEKRSNIFIEAEKDYEKIEDERNKEINNKLEKLANNMSSILEETKLQNKLLSENFKIITDIPRQLTEYLGQLRNMVCYL